MGLESYMVFTVSCDIPDCRERKTSGSMEVLENDGWCNIEIFNTKFEICPEHKKDLQEFFFNSSKM